MCGIKDIAAAVVLGFITNGQILPFLRRDRHITIFPDEIVEGAEVEFVALLHTRVGKDGLHRIEQIVQDHINGRVRLWPSKAILPNKAWGQLPIASAARSLRTKRLPVRSLSAPGLAKPRFYGLSHW